MSLDERANLFNRMVLDDAMDEYGLIRHSLTTPDRKPIPLRATGRCPKKHRTTQAIRSEVASPRRNAGVRHV